MTGPLSTQSGWIGGWVGWGRMGGMVRGSAGGRERVRERGCQLGRRRRQAGPDPPAKRVGSTTRQAAPAPKVHPRELLLRLAQRLPLVALGGAEPLAAQLHRYEPHPRPRHHRPVRRPLVALLGLRGKAGDAGLSCACDSRRAAGPAHGRQPQRQRQWLAAPCAPVPASAAAADRSPFPAPRPLLRCRPAAAALLALPVAPRPAAVPAVPARRRPPQTRPPPSPALESAATRPPAARRWWAPGCSAAWVRRQGGHWSAAPRAARLQACKHSSGACAAASAWPQRTCTCGGPGCGPGPTPAPSGMRPGFGRSRRCGNPPCAVRAGTRWVLLGAEGRCWVLRPGAPSTQHPHPAPRTQRAPMADEVDDFGVGVRGQAQLRLVLGGLFGRGRGRRGAAGRVIGAGRRAAPAHRVVCGRGGGRGMAWGGSRSLQLLCEPLRSHGGAPGQRQQAGKWSQAAPCHPAPAPSSISTSANSRRILATLRR